MWGGGGRRSEGRGEGVSEEDEEQAALTDDLHPCKPQ